MFHRKSWCAFFIVLLAVFAPVTLADDAAAERSVVDEVIELVLAILDTNGDEDEFGGYIEPT